MISFEGVLTTEKALMRTYDVKVKVDPLNQEKPKQTRRTNPPSLGNDDSLSLHNDAHPHVRACFGSNGQLVKVLPNRPNDGQPAMVELLEVQNALGACQDAKDLNLYPGPLSRDGIHKKNVLLFCQRKALKCMEDVTIVDKESAQLLWKFLELLIKQNGTFVGKDIIDLLVKGHEPDAMRFGKSLMTQDNNVKGKSSPRVRGRPRKGSNRSKKSSCKPVVDVTTTVGTAIVPKDDQREGHIAKFRHMLLYGKKKDAIECAVKYHLWGHAFFLSSMMDQKLHASVKSRFASSTILMNDPLQTLYQLMSRHRPSSVTDYSDEKFGDWRPHLAMIISNQTSKDNLDRTNIIALGDTLASKGRVYASHVCYLMAQVPFGTYDKKTSKIVLLGGNHRLPLKDFATVDAIQYTEVYEYSQTLSNPAFCLPHFQLYKYLYACRLLDFGLVSEAFMYCEVIASAISRHPAYFQPSFVQLVFELSSRLNYTNPQHQTSQVDPVRVQQVQGLLAQYAADFTIKPDSGMITTTDLGDGSVEWNDGSGGVGGLTHQQQQQQFDNETHFTMEVDDGDDDYHDDDADDFKPPKSKRTVSTISQGNEENHDDDADDFKPPKSKRTVSTISQGNEESDDEDADGFKPPKSKRTASTISQGNEESDDEDDDDDDDDDQDDDDEDYKPPSDFVKSATTQEEGVKRIRRHSQLDKKKTEHLAQMSFGKKRGKSKKSTILTEAEDSNGGLNSQDPSVIEEKNAPKDSINTNETEENVDDDNGNGGDDDECNDDHDDKEKIQQLDKSLAGLDHLENATHQTSPPKSSQSSEVSATAASSSTSSTSATVSGEGDVKEGAPKKKRGRPRIKFEEKGPKRKRGRPPHLSDEERARRAARKGMKGRPRKYFVKDNMIKNEDGTYSADIEVTADGEIKCRICNKVVSTKFNNLRRHIRNHKTPIRFTCVLCGKGFQIKSHLNIHMKRHSQIRPFKCDTCGKGCFSKSQLKEHTRTHSGKKPFKCSSCEKWFPSKGCLSQHKNAVHLKLKPYICELCGKASFTAAIHKTHLDFHAGKKSCKCSICGLLLYSISHLNQHMKTHLEGRQKDFSCSLCEKNYYNKASLKRHMLFHTGERPFGCDLCGKTFTQNSALKTHKKSHRTENLHTYSLCNKTPATNSSLSSHLKLHCDTAMLETSQNDSLCSVSDKKSDALAYLPSLPIFSGYPKNLVASPNLSMLTINNPNTGVQSGGQNGQLS